MRILLTNDDGIHAPGIHELAERLSGRHEVYVVAPDYEKSATSAAITLQHPLRVREFRPPSPRAKCYYHVNGTPADCVKIALRVIMKGGAMPDVVISGINHGANMGVDVRYSGTVAAAFEGVFAGIPSIAVSSATFDPHPRYDTAAGFIVSKLDFLVRKLGEIERGCVLNVNVPSVAPDVIKGFRITRLNNFRYEDSYKEVADPNDRAHYWLSGERTDIEEDAFTDLVCVRENHVSITPLQMDQTSAASLAALRKS